MEEMEFFKRIQNTARFDRGEACPAEGILSGAYFLVGEEEYAKSKAVRQTTELVDGDLRAINTDRLTRCDAETVKGACEMLPLFGPRRVVVVSELTAEQSKSLAEYVLSVPETAVLLIVQQGEAKKTDALFKKLSGENRVVAFSRYEPDRAVMFLQKRAASREMRISSATARHLIDLVGTDLGTLESWLFRTADYVGENREITAKDVDKCVTPGADYKIFEMFSAMMAGKRGDGMRILYGMLQNGESPMGLIIFLEGRLKGMLSAKRMLKAGMAEKEAAKALGGNPYAASKTVQEAAKVAEGWLEDAVIAFTEAESAVVSGRIIGDKEALMLAVSKAFSRIEKEAKQTGGRR